MSDCGGALRRSRGGSHGRHFGLDSGGGFCKGIPSFPADSSRGRPGENCAGRSLRGGVMRSPVIIRGVILASVAGAALAGETWAQNRDKAWEVVPEVGYVTYGRPNLGDGSTTR